MLKDLVTSRKAALIAALSLIALGFGATLWWQSGRVSDAVVTEAVNDHLRVLYAAKAVEVESAVPAQIRTWFSGRLDFAPAIDFAGDKEFALQGASVAYFLDRKAAAFVYKRGNQVASVLAFRASGLPLALRGSGGLERVSASKVRMRGFTVLLWRDSDLGYALVSDLGDAELVRLGNKISAAAPQ
ncbi:MAG TPA: hypothetical protein VG937_20020 [Polyangiaceae bacterium]|nr:hypothetical protein [Polyangiaceae bacterium]